MPYEAADYPGAGTAAVEFVTPSITSNNIDEMVGLPEGNGLSQAAQGALTTANHHVRWVDLDRHGFTIVEFTPDYAHADYWAVTSLTDPGAGAYPLASWRVRHGTDRLETAGPCPESPPARALRPVHRWVRYRGVSTRPVPGCRHARGSSR